ncbi:MAG: hypothetical protein ACYS1C_07000 [Planctomycetota bacterium]
MADADQQGKRAGGQGVRRTGAAVVVAVVGLLFVFFVFRGLRKFIREGGLQFFAEQPVRFLVPLGAAAVVAVGGLLIMRLPQSRQRQIWFFGWATANVLATGFVAFCVYMAILFWRVDQDMQELLGEMPAYLVGLKYFAAAMALFWIAVLWRSWRGFMLGLRAGPRESTKNGEPANGKGPADA